VVADRRLGEALVDSIGAGADIGVLMRRHGLPYGAGVRHPEGFWVAPHAYGEAGSAAFTLAPGAVAGPIRLDSSRYSVVALLEVQAEAPAPLEAVRDQVRRDLVRARSYDAIRAVVEKQARSSRIEIDRTALSRIDALEGALVAYKTHFPNRLAVPGTLPFDPRSPWFTRAAGAAPEGAQ